MSSRDRDEHYVLKLCDQALGVTGSRQHRLPILIGDPGPSGRCVPLPIDAYYETLRLAVEYRERQHSEPVTFWDRKPTLSGCSRGEQRRRYDERRRIVLPRHGIRLLKLDYAMFAHDSRKRLRRDREADLLVIQSALANILPGRSAAYSLL